MPLGLKIFPSLIFPHRCIGYECECPSGFELSEDESHCQDINECELYDNESGENDEDSDDYYEDKKNQPKATFCSHTCTNLIGLLLKTSFSFFLKTLKFI